MAKTSVSRGPGLLLSLLACLAVVALVAVACGGVPGPVGDPVTIVTHAPDATLAAGSARIEVDGPNEQTLGVVDFASGNADYKLAIAPGYEHPPDQVSGRIVTVGGVVYFRPAASPAAKKGTPLPAWQRLAAGTPPGLGSTVMRFGDPIADIDLLRGTQHILSDGGGEVDGVSTARYTLQIDPTQAIEATPAARQPALKALLGGRTDFFNVDVWIDGKDRVREVQVPIDLTHHTPATRPDFMPIADSVDFITFGPPVPETAPI